MSDEDLRELLSTLTPIARNALRRALIRDQPDRDAIATELIHYGDQAGFDWADIIDALTLHPDEQRRGTWRTVGHGKVSSVLVPI